MPGISQVWLTAEELEAIATAYDALETIQRTSKTACAKVAAAALTNPRQKGARDKILRALAPVACDLASGCTLPDRVEEAARAADVRVPERAKRGMGRAPGEPTL